MIRPFEAGDEAAWRSMWADYCAFYKETIPEAVTANLWQRLLDPAMPILGFIANDSSEQSIGFAHAVLHPHTWSDRTLCYLEDLFVTPSSRGQNVGHDLIQHLIAEGQRLGWARVYWHTETGNAPARRLYDRFHTADDYVRYTVKL